MWEREPPRGQQGRIQTSTRSHAAREPLLRRGLRRQLSRRSGLSTSHKMYRSPIDRSVHVLNVAVLNILFETEFASPISIGQLPRCMCGSEIRLGKQSYLFIALFPRVIFTFRISKRCKRRYERRHCLFPCNALRPVATLGRPPKSVGRTGGPSDAIVAPQTWAGYAVESPRFASTYADLIQHLKGLCLSRHRPGRSIRKGSGSVFCFTMISIHYLTILVRVRQMIL